MHTKKQLSEKMQLGLVTEQDFEGMSASDVYAAKSEVGFRVEGSAHETKVLDKEARTIRYIGSTEHMDRAGDRIRQRGRTDGPGANGAGWKLAGYARAGGPFFWCHRSDEPAIGSATRVWVDDVMIDGKTEPALLFDIQYLKSGISDLADLAWSLASGEGLPNGRAAVRGVSVGFRPLKIYRPQDDDERALLGLGTYGWEIQEAELLELSQAPIPCNPYAVAIEGKSIEKSVELALGDLVSSGKVTKAQADLWVKTYGLGPQDSLERARARVRAFVDMGADLGRSKAAEAMAHRLDLSIVQPESQEKGVTKAEGDVTVVLNAAQVASLRACHDYLDQCLQTVASVLDTVDTAAGLGGDPEDDEPGEVATSYLDAMTDRVLESVADRIERAIADALAKSMRLPAGGSVGALDAPKIEPLPEAKDDAAPQVAVVKQTPAPRADLEGLLLRMRTRLRT